MKLLEYEAKHLLSLADIQTPKSFVVDENSPPFFLPVVLKSQVPIGGRGKAGGISVVYTSEEYTLNTSRILSLDIKGFTPKQLLAEELINIERELYLSLLIDRRSASIILMAHINGGVEIEENNVDDFLRYSLTDKNLLAAGEQLAEYFDLPEKSFVLQDLVKNLYACMIKNDATLLEINPLILTKDGEIVAGDCKMELDDAAAFRHPEWNFEDEAAEVNFVTLDNQGTVATIANGAGLAMATVDAVADAGLVPANFLDIGGGANEASVLAAFKRIMEYPNIDAIIINIFAGITRCDEIAKAIIAARTQINALPPLYIRLAGTNFEQAVELLTAEQITTLSTLESCIEAVKTKGKS